jgi:hypothetical protein
MMVYFDTEAQRDLAFKALNTVTVNDQALFSCSIESDRRLFCKVRFSDEAAPNAPIHLAGHALRGITFGALFKLITFKTGHHHADGFVIAPRHALGGLASEGVVPLVKLTEVMFRMAGLRDAGGLASELRRAA